MGLIQLVNFPTRNLNTLDLIFTNRPPFIFDLQPGPNLGNSDHLSINFKLTLKKSKNHSIAPKFDFYRADYNSLNTYFANNNWKDILCSVNDIELRYQRFIYIIHQGVRILFHYPDLIQNLNFHLILLAS